MKKYMLEEHEPKYYYITENAAPVSGKIKSLLAIHFTNHGYYQPTKVSLYSLQPTKVATHISNRWQQKVDTPHNNPMKAMDRKSK